MRMDEMERRKQEHRGELEALYESAQRGEMTHEQLAERGAVIIGIPGIDEQVEAVKRIGRDSSVYMNAHEAEMTESFDSVEWLMAIGHAVSMMLQRIGYPPGIFLGSAEIMALAAAILVRDEQTKGLRTMYGTALEGGDAEITD